LLFISADDFFEKVNRLTPISREEELNYAKEMAACSAEAREKIVNGYLPFVSGYIRHLPESMQTFNLVLRCCSALEKAVDTFNFMQDGERFSHRLSWWLRQTVTQYIAEKRT